jgi:hypothetical protein
MSYFTEQDARSIIRNAYGEVQSDDTKVAASIYGAEEIAGLSAPSLVVGVGHPCTRGSLRTGPTWAGANRHTFATLAGAGVGRGLDTTRDGGPGECCAGGLSQTEGPGRTAT